MLRKKEFDEGILMITQVFGEAPIKGPRLLRIKSLTEGRVSGKGFIEICENICDNLRQIPLPSDFDKAVIEWRKRFFAEYGYQYSDHGKDTVIDAQYMVIDCSKCNDVGFVKITHKVQPSNFESLMVCDCTKDHDPMSDIPEWDNALSGAFVCEPCPTEWFKPEISENDSDAKVKSKVWERIEFWKSKQRNAEKHWKQVRGK